MSYSQATFSPNQFWQESYQQHQSQPQVSTVSFHEFGHRIAPHRHCGLSTDLCFSQPRYLPPQDLARLSTFQEHHREESYTALSDSHAAKGRSFSGTNTDSTEYDFAVVSTSPRTAYFLGGAGGQYAIAKYMPDEAEEKSPHGISLSDFGQLENGNYPISLPQQDACIAASSNSPATRRKLPCPHTDCTGRDGRPNKFFSRKADVSRHLRSQHQKTFIDCPRPKCNRKGTHGFTRKDHLTEHLRGFHMEDHPKRQAKKNIRKARKNKLQRLVGDTAIPAKPSPRSSASILDVKPEDDSQDAADEEWMFHDYKSELDARTPKQEEEENYAELNALFHGQHEADVHGNTSTSPGQQHQGLIEEHGPPWEGHHNNGTYQHGPHGLQCGRQHSSALSPTMLKSESHTMVDEVGQMYVPYDDMGVYMHDDSSLRHLYHTSSHMHSTS